MKRFLFLLIAFIAVLTAATAQSVAQMNEWSRLAQEADDAKQYADAIGYYELYLDGYGRNYSTEDETYQLVLFKLARCHYNNGNYLKATEYGEKEAALTLALYGKNDEEFATSMQNLAVYYDYLGDVTKATHCGQAAADAYKAAVGDNSPKYAQALSNLARYLSETGYYSEAVQKETAAMGIFKIMAGDGDERYLTSLNNLAVYTSQLGDAQKALEYGTMVQEAYLARGGQDAAYAMTLDNLANFHSAAGDYSKASELFLQALRILRNTVGTNHPDYATVLSDIANNMAMLGNPRQAISLGTKALDIRKATLGAGHPLCAQSLNNLSHYFSALNDYARAISYGEQALAIWQPLSDGMNLDYAACLNNLANYYATTGDIGKAVERCVRSAEIRKAVLGENHPEYAHSMNNLASLLFRHGEYQRALETGTLAVEASLKSLGDSHPDYATVLSNLAGYHTLLGHYDEGLESFRQSININHNNVLQQFAGLTTRRRDIFWSNISNDFTNVYPTYAFRSHAATAADLYDKSALFAKGLLLSTEIEMNRLIQESGDREALRLFEELQQSRLLLQRENETPVAQRHLNTDSLTRAVNRMERELMQRSKVYGDFTRRLRTTWQDVQKMLKSDEIAVEFLSFQVYGTDSTMLAALTLRPGDKEPAFTPLFEQRQLQGVSDPVYYHCPELTQLVWQPLQQRLEGVRRIFFAPAGVLHNIGIEYAPGMEEYEMYRLSTTREINTQPTTHPQPFPKGGENVLAVLFGGVDYNAPLASGSTPSLRGGQGEVLTSLPEGTAELPDLSVSLHRSLVDSLSVRGLTSQYLPATLTEVEEIRDAFENQHLKTQLHTGNDATETAVRTLGGKAPQILHLATHGFYFTPQQAERQQQLRFLGQDNQHGSQEEKAMARSGLLFAGANQALQGQEIPLGTDDGVLTAQEISRLDLRGLDLVVLSACKTGNGDLRQGEGVFGLQRGLKKAGVQTIVMSLWEVDDEATQILMTTFYNHLLAGRSKRDAFRGAQHYLRSIDNGRFSHPAYWAAFVLLD